MIAARDPYGMKPLCIGRLPDGSTIIASETAALDAVQATFLREVEPGEVVVVDEEGTRTERPEHAKAKEAFCLFELVYFMNDDSLFRGQRVGDIRRRVGNLLANTYPLEADMVVPVLQSGKSFALGYAEISGISYVEALAKNSGVPRSFLYPTQSERKSAVRRKVHHDERYDIRGKRLVVVDDSVVRSNTVEVVVEILHEAGAGEVTVLSGAPQYRNSCYYGMDTRKGDELVARHLTSAEIDTKVGAPVRYIPLALLVWAASGGQTDKAYNAGFCTGCFDGKYPTAVPVDLLQEHTI
jgi:amidophosphoribosyltransferase